MQADRFYRLDPSVPGTVPETPRLAAAVEVERLRAEGIHGERAFLYVTTDDPAIRQDRTHFWAEQPGRLFQRALIQYWDSANLAERVVPPDLRQATRYRVTGRISRLEEERTPQGAGSQLRLAMTLNLVDRESRNLIVRHRYTLSAPTEPARASVARAASDLLVTIADDFGRRAVLALADQGAAAARPEESPQ